jgi:hypothetical protein
MYEICPMLSDLADCHISRRETDPMYPSTIVLLGLWRKSMPTHLSVGFAPMSCSSLVGIFNKFNHCLHNLHW